MPKLCFVVYDLSIVGGVERVVEGLANKLCGQKYDVYIVSLHGETVNPALKLNDSIRIEHMRLSEGRLRAQMVEGTKKLIVFFRDNKIDIAFLEATFVGFIGAPLRFLTKTKIVFCDHGALLNQWDEKDVRIMRRIAAIASDRIVVLTKKSKDDYIQRFKIRERKISNIYNWISEAVIDSRRQYDEESKTIVTAGRFTKEKGFDLLIEVAKEIMPQNMGWQWHIYGEGPLERDIRDRIEANGLSGFIVLKGFSDNMSVVYQHTALYVLPSYREGVPLVLLEAKAYKIPSISFDILTGPNEIIMDGINGFLIEPYNTELMAEKIRQLICDSETRKKLSQNAYDNLDLFREETVFAQWIKLIEELSLR